MIVTITGANDLLRKRELDSLVATFAADYGDMAIERLDGEDVSAERMRESLASLPFLSPKKMVVLREPSKQKAFADAIADVLKDVADTTDVIIHEPKLDKRSTYYKTLKKATDFREFAELDVAGLVKWAVDYVREQGGVLSPADARLLVDRVGANQHMLQSELAKLLLYNPKITRQAIEQLTDRTPQSTVFELLDAAFAGNARRAFELYREQRSMRVEPQVIVAMLAWQLHVLAMVKAATARSAEEIAKAAKLNPYVVRKSQGIVRTLTMGQIKAMISDLLEVDIQSKRTDIDLDEALQLYLLKLAEMKHNSIA